MFSYLKLLVIFCQVSKMMVSLQMFIINSMNAVIKEHRTQQASTD